jgi:hypothetical protein
MGDQDILKSGALGLETWQAADPHDAVDFSLESQARCRQGWRGRIEKIIEAHRP